MQQQTHPSTLAVIGQEVRRLGRGLRGMGRAIWATQSYGLARDTQRLRAFLKQPPRWFVVSLVLVGVCLSVYCALVFTGAVASQAAWLRSQMP